MVLWRYILRNKTKYLIMGFETTQVGQYWWQQLYMKTNDCLVILQDLTSQLGWHNMRERWNQDIATCFGLDHKRLTGTTLNVSYRITMILLVNRHCFESRITSIVSIRILFWHMFSSLESLRSNPFAKSEAQYVGWSSPLNFLI